MYMYVVAVPRLMVLLTNKALGRELLGQKHNPSSSLFIVFAQGWILNR